MPSNAIRLRAVNRTPRRCPFSMRTPFVFNCHGLPAGVFFPFWFLICLHHETANRAYMDMDMDMRVRGFSSPFAAFFQPFFLLSARFVTRRVEFQGLRLWHTRLGLRITGYGLGTKGGFWRHPALRSIKIKITFTGVNCQPTRIAEEFVESKDLKES